ncbi:aminotransferase class I/II-fold pyridoxal phosphate-dependent enzyme [Patescibacteria group bacterium]|nr:aminotransferase class I/II-fold pyridoxal phosphate-dependent enzyme [Patescibacteria group bacterium]
MTQKTIERRSWLPEGKQNLFQAVKAKRAEAEARGIKVLNLAIGQPTGPAFLVARMVAAQAVMSKEESMHEYQDNGSPGVPDFARKFVQLHVKRDLGGEDVTFLPIPGIKPMLGLIPLACGAAGRDINVGTMTRPGYPTPADWCSYLGVETTQLLLTPENEFRFASEDITAELLMLNYPHNPSGQVATREWWQEICASCQKNGIRIFNDAAYAMLAHTKEACTLSEVAPDYPDLSWAEAFSASKAIGNGTGWRVGAIAGSPDFVKDIATIKGNTDSGFVAPMAAGALAALQDGMASVVSVRETYARRISLLISALKAQGMELAVQPGAGFFTLWKVPKIAFGEPVLDAEQFNFHMIEETGVTGVHFNPDYIRYAVCGDVEAMLPDIVRGFQKAAVSYE